jgi:GxxExxY protein
MKQKFENGTYEIIGAAMEVHKRLGPGLLEAAYKEALAIEFTERGIPFVREVPFPVMYKGKQTSKLYRVDFVCGAKVVEIKALKNIANWERSVTINYLKHSPHKVALLINFGALSLQHERYVDEYNPNKK